MATSFTTLLQRGYRWVLVAEVEGIPYLFAEMDPDRIDADAKPSLPSGYTSLSESLLIMPGQSIGIEIDRQSGVASGDAWDMVLSRDALVEEGLQSTLFVRPSNTTVITADVAAGDTTITVSDASGFASSGSIDIGREHVTYSGTTATTFTGCTRGVLGYAYAFASTGENAYRLVADVPTVWRGRWVTLHQHLLSPSGHMLDSTWLTGTYHRILWRGYVDAPPRPGAYGMQLRCLPLVRVMGRSIGSGVSGTINSVPSFASPQNYDLMMQQREGWDGYAVYVTPGASLTITVSVTDGTVVEYTTTAVPVATDTGLTIGAWRSLIIAAIDTAWGGSAWFDSVYDGGSFPVDIVIKLASGWSWADAELSAVAGPGCYWLTGQFQQQMLLDGDTAAFDYTGNLYGGLNLHDHAWVPVADLAGLDILDQTIPSTGVGMVTQDGDAEILRWDSTNSDVDGQVLIRISQRAIGGKSVWLAAGGSFEVAVGNVGKIGAVLRQMLTSSGTTLRGADDVLSIGYALDGDWAPSTSIADLLPGALDDVPAVITGRGSAEDVVGGWLALAGRAVVQRRSSSGEVVLAVVDTFPVADTSGTTITAADIEISGTTLPALADGPTAVEIDASVVGSTDETKILVGSAERMLAEGTRTWGLRAPGITPLAAAMLGGQLVERLGGETLIAMPVAPWVDVQPGDVAVLTVAHPLLYNYGNGSWGAATLNARVMGLREDLRTGARMVVFLAAGGDAEPLSLCPTATIGTKNSTTDFDLGTGEGAYFVAGDLIQFYTPGDEASEKQTRTIDTVTDDNITITVAASAWVGVGTRVTYPANASATSVQDASFMYVLASKVWKG